MELVMCVAMLGVIYFAYACFNLFCFGGHSRECGGFRYEFFDYGYQDFWDNHKCIEGTINIDMDAKEAIKPDYAVKDWD